MIGVRRKARALALQALYEVDSAGHEAEGVEHHLLAKGELDEENAELKRLRAEGVLT